MEIFFWLVSAASIVGVILNIQKKRASFLIWIGTNASWAVIDFARGIPQQGVLFVVYAFLAVWGWFSWQHAAPVGRKRLDTPGDLG